MVGQLSFDQFLSTPGKKKCPILGQNYHAVHSGFNIGVFFFFRIF